MLFEDEKNIFRDSAQKAKAKNGKVHNKIVICYNAGLPRLDFMLENNGELFSCSPQRAGEFLPLFISVQKFHLTDSQK